MVSHPRSSSRAHARHIRWRWPLAGSMHGTPRRRARGLAALAAVSVVVVMGAPARAQECASCHEEVATAFAKTPHGRAFGAKGGVAWDCSSCHGPGQAHIESADPTKIVNPAKAEEGAVNETCLACHQGSSEPAHWRGSIHETAGLACVSCHAVHYHPEKAGVHQAATATPSWEGTATTQLCLKCHVAQRRSLNQRSTHPVRERKMDCASCHDPHGGTREKLLRSDSTNDLCYSCHQEKRSPMLWDHSPVREDCLTCHTPHGSNHERLLVARVNQLCQSCHLQGRHQTVAGASSAMWNTNRGCVNCHAQVHGSNHPSGVLFQR